MQHNATIVAFDPRNPAHKTQFAHLNREWLEKYFYVEPQDERMFADPEGTVLAKGGVILMAELDGATVGTGSLLPLEQGCYEIAKMAVTEACQKFGIGRKLVAELITRAEKLGATKLYIVSNTKLEPAIRLYRQFGFADSAEVRHAHYARGDITLEKLVARG